jgi:hypothetical protein
MRPKPILVVLLSALPALTTPALGEPAYKALSVSQTVTSHAFARNTIDVTIVSDGESTCYFRLFTDADTPGDATTAHGPLKKAESIRFTFTPGRGSEGYVGPIRANYYKSISAICSSGQTATWRVYTK